MLSVEKFLVTLMRAPKAQAEIFVSPHLFDRCYAPAPSSDGLSTLCLSCTVNEFLNQAPRNNRIHPTIARTSLKVEIMPWGGVWIYALLWELRAAVAMDDWHSPHASHVTSRCTNLITSLFGCSEFCYNFVSKKQYSRKGYRK